MNDFETVRESLDHPFADDTYREALDALDRLEVEVERLRGEKLSLQKMLTERDRDLTKALVEGEERVAEALAERQHREALAEVERLRYENRGLREHLDLARKNIDEDRAEAERLGQRNARLVRELVAYGLSCAAEVERLRESEDRLAKNGYDGVVSYEAEEEE